MNTGTGIADLDGVCSTLVRTWTGSHFPCLTGPSRTLHVSSTVQPESFTAMLVGELLLDVPGFRELTADIVSMLESELGDDNLFFFFKDHERLPADADCTAVGLSVLLRADVDVRAVGHSALDRIIANSNESGIVETYFDPTGERSGIVDPIVCCNVLYLACQLGRESELGATAQFVVDTLVSGRYLAGTRYYPSPDAFLFFLARVVGAWPASRLAQRVGGALQSALAARVGSSETPIELAQRVLACAWLGMANSIEAARLGSLRRESGWEPDGLFQYGRSKIHFGSSGLSTAFALAALHAIGESGSRWQVRSRSHTTH